MSRVSIMMGTSIAIILWSISTLRIWRTRTQCWRLRLRRFATRHPWHRHRSFATGCPWHDGCDGCPGYMAHRRGISDVLSAGGRCIRPTGSVMTDAQPILSTTFP